MAFMKYARGKMVHPTFEVGAWEKVRVAKGHISNNLIEQAGEIFQQPFVPSNYLLSHVTIVASVDTSEVSHKKVGSFVEEGRKVNRKFSNFRITPETQQWINNNNDAWSREVLMKSYRTFIGAQNFQEHVQLEEHSKGRIIDAVARDIGPSVYIDILVATDRKHRELVAAIQNGKMSTLSMGCFLPGTLVTMSDGTRIPIEDVAPGDTVITHTGSIKEVANKQIKSWYGGVRKIKVVGNPTVITATDNHPFVVYRPNDFCACGCDEELTQTKDRSRNLNRRFKHGHDKRVYNPNNTYSLEEARSRKYKLQDIKSHTPLRVRADDLREGDFLCFPRNIESKEVPGITLGKARLLGYFLAEGSFLKRDGVCAVEFNFSIEEKSTYVKEVVDLLQSEFELKNPPWLQDREDRNTCTVHVSGRQIAEWFLHFGGEYSSKKKLDASVIQWPVEYQKELLGAWINGDGYLHKQHGATIGTTTSFDLACQMQAISAKCGMVTRMVARLDGRSVQLDQVMNGGSFTRSLETHRHPSFDIWFGKIVSSELSGYTDKVPFDRGHHKDSRVLEDVVLYPITSIESDFYEGWVHNMEVEDDHSYIVEGMSTFNCSIDFSQCTKCGHVAADETEMCPCIKYEKGNAFYDEFGSRQKIAELCGHHTHGDTGGVTFIEGSWVGTPAFTGAVLRNILNPENFNSETLKQAQMILSRPPEQWASDLSNLKTGSHYSNTKYSEDFDFGDDGGEDTEEAPKKEDSPFQDMENSIYQEMLDKVQKRLKKDLNKDEIEKALTPEDSTISPNNNVIKQASLYRSALKVLIKTANSDADFINKLSLYNGEVGISIPVEIYRASLKLGSTEKYRSLDQFLKSCRKVLGRRPSVSEQKTLIRLAKLLSLQEE